MWTGAWLILAARLQVNQTFEELALLRDLHELWGVLGPQIFNFMNDSTNVAMLQVGRDGGGPLLGGMQSSKGGERRPPSRSLSSFPRNCWMWRAQGGSSRHPKARSSWRLSETFWILVGVDTTGRRLMQTWGAWQKYWAKSWR